MKVFTCTTTAVGVEKLWDAAVGRDIMIHYIGKTVPKNKNLYPILYTFEVTMDEEEALVVVLSNSGLSLVAK